MAVVKKSFEDISGPGGDTCVVCFKNFEIYSIGECDHPVCYECSTRMRVLCQQNECPICRQSLSKVIFTNEKKVYRDLETKGRTEYYNKKYKIAFATIFIQKAFYNLLDHRCSMCNCRAFHSFEALKDHVRKEHEHFYCDICTDNLKIFSFERKCYNRQDLGMHRRKGDPDNKSHRGHPLCQYCDCRFLDRDDLFRHLRREHYFCHFCDADGSNQFYADYDSLRTHFREDHFLCEEGDCAREQFTAVFRSEIDLKAHISSVHGKTLGKLQAKQARTLQLQITLGPRNRTNQHESDQLGHNSRARNGNSDHRYENGYNRPKVHKQPTPPTIDAQNEQEFPSLEGASHKSTVTTLMHPSLSLLHKSGPSGLARTKENFPALGGKAEVIDESGVRNTNNKNQLPASVVVKKNRLIHHKPQESMVIHVASRPNSMANELIPNKNHFPALPSKLKHTSSLEEDFIPCTSNLTNTKVVAAKHRLLLNEYVSEANSNANQKLQLVPNTTDKNKSAEVKTYSLANNDFPALVPIPSSNIHSKPKSIARVECRKSKDNNGSLTTYEKMLGKNSVLLKKSKSNSNIDLTNKKPNKKPNKTYSKKSMDNKNKTNENNNVCSAINNNNVESPRPDSAKSKILKPPPGFQAVTLNSLTKSNDLTFTTSLGEIFTVLPSPNLYLPPPDSMKRNQALILRFGNILPSSEEFEEFRCISKKFREGTYETFGFVEYCQAVLKEHFDEIFPELLVLLPDISKQQELYLLYSQHIKKNIYQKTEYKLEICSECKQILKHADVVAHKKSHDLNLNFPHLSN